MNYVPRKIFGLIEAVVFNEYASRELVDTKLHLTQISGGTGFNKKKKLTWSKLKQLKVTVNEKQST
jgi:hypothetical protein